MQSTPESWQPADPDCSRRVAPKFHAYFAKRNIKVLMWHDMFLQPNHP